MGVKRAIGGAECWHSVGLCVKYKIQIQEYNNKCNSEGTVHVGMSMCMYIIQIQIHKYNNKYKSAGTVHVRRCAHHMASPPFALHKMKETFDSFEVSENILQKDSSPHAREGRWNFFGGAPLFFCVCSQFITVISSLQPTGQNALDQNNLQCGRSSFERKTS